LYWGKKLDIRRVEGKNGEVVGLCRTTRIREGIEGRDRRKGGGAEEAFVS